MDRRRGVSNAYGLQPVETAHSHVENCVHDRTQVGLARFGALTVLSRKTPVLIEHPGSAGAEGAG